MTFFRTWAMLRPFASHVRSRTVWIVIASVLSSASEAVALALIVGIATSLSSGGSGELVLPILDVRLPTIAQAIIAVAAELVALGGHLLIARLTAGLTADVIASARMRVLTTYLDASWETQSVEKEGMFQQAIGPYTTIAAGLMGTLMSAISAGLMFVVYIVSATVANAFATAAILAIGFLVILAMRPISARTRSAASKFANTQQAFAQHVGRFASTSMEYKLFGVQNAIRDQFLGYTSQLRADQMRSRFFVIGGSSLFRDLVLTLMVVAIGAATLLPGADWTAIVAVIALVLRGTLAANQLNQANQSINEVSPQLELLLERLDEWESAQLPEGTLEAGGLARIELRDVGYTYPDQTQGLSHVSLEIEAGESLGVIGRSGAGKSTLAQILLRLRRPTTGAVLVDDTDYRQFSAASWARTVGFVPQEPALLSGTIRENIDFNRGLSDEVIVRAARDAHIAPDIAAMAGGFDTVLGPRGQGLSGGQKQRVAIARALAGAPKVLVLDEPSSALDPRSERLLAETLAELRGRTTVVIVAHRLKTVESCDRMIVVEGGEITTIGTPAELLGPSGQYLTLLEGTADVPQER